MTALLPAAGLTLAGLAVLAVTGALTVRARRRSQDPARMSPWHPAGLAASAALIAAGGGIEQEWALAGACAVGAVILAVITVRAAQLRRALRRSREEQAEIELAVAEWERLAEEDPS